MLTQFKTASRKPEEMTAAQQEIRNTFDIIKGKGGKLDKAGMRELKNNEMELGELIIQLMNDQVAVTDPTPFMVDVRSGDFGADYLWQEIRSGLRVVDRAYGSKPQGQALSFTEYQLFTNSKEIVVEVALEQIASGRYDAGLISQVMADTVNRYRTAFILNQLDAGVPSAADRSGKSGWTQRYTGLTEGNLQKAVWGLLDEGATPNIFGRYSALAGIQAFAGWSTNGSNDAMREFETRGMVGQYNGAPIVQLNDQFSRRTSDHVIRNDRVYLASNQTPKGAIYQTADVSFLDFSEVLPAESVYRVGTRIEDGMLVWNSYAYRIITVS